MIKQWYLKHLLAKNKKNLTNHQQLTKTLK